VRKYARIERDALPSHLDAWIERYGVFAPMMRDGVRRFGVLSAGSDAQPGPWLTKVPVKEMFLPQTECLYRYRRGTNGGLEIETPQDPARLRLIFGVRPCDARALTLLDHVFRSTDRPDPYYCARRESTILVGIGCSEPRSVCFCTSVGGSPFGEEGLDVLLVETGGDYVAKALTLKGEALIAEMPEAAPEDTETLIAEARRHAEASMGDAVLTAGLKERLDSGFDAPLWDRIHEPCIGCGVCAFLCPTCHCFDLAHEADTRSVAGDAGRCVRGWDTCMFSLFTRQASGVNPRPSGKERMRQRLMHKFRYFVENYGEAACVGCGRCIANCPTACDIRETIARIDDAAEADSHAQET